MAGTFAGAVAYVPASVVAYVPVMVSSILLNLVEDMVQFYQENTKLK